MELAEKSSQTSQIEATTPETWKRRWVLLVDLVVLVALALVLYWGTSTQFSNLYGDMTRYQCYAIVFWQGQAGLQTHHLIDSATSQCAFLNTNTTASGLLTSIEKRHYLAPLLALINAQPSNQAFSALPPEYPLLTLVPFSLALLAPFQIYQVAFSLIMTPVAFLIYFALTRYRSRGSAI